MRKAARLASLSVFMPCFNEAGNLRLVVRRLVRTLPTIAKKWEIIVVNDGSTDQTVQVVKSLQRHHSQLRLVQHARNLGYGAAVRSGIKAAQYEWLFLTDGDGQFDVKQLQDWLPLTQQVPIILGYRVNRAEGWRRALNAKLFKMYIDSLFHLGVRDIDCAFKLMRADLVQKLPLTSNGALISTELLYQLKHKKVKWREQPVVHLPRRYGKPTGNHPRIIMKALTESLYLWRTVRTS